MGVMKKAMDSTEEATTFDLGRAQVIRMGGATITRNTFEPGWRWVDSLKPMVKTDSCQVHHVGYVVSGTLHVKPLEGSELELGPGDAYDIQPGHEGWVVGDEPVQMVEFSGEVR